jgi:hypothetical protein
MSSGHSEARTFPAFWPHLKFIGLAFCQKASSSPAELSYDLCQITLSEVRVDEEFYIASYPDVVRLLAEGRYCSVSDHYVRTGFFECKLPSHIAVDADYYLEINPDVKLALQNGQVESAQAHFERSGWKEGRAPSPGFSRLAGSPIAQELRRRAVD